MLLKQNISSRFLLITNYSFSKLLVYIILNFAALSQNKTLKSRLMIVKIKMRLKIIRSKKNTLKKKFFQKKNTPKKNKHKVLVKSKIIIFNKKCLNQKYIGNSITYNQQQEVAKI